MSEPLQSIEEVEQYLKTMLIAIQDQQDILLGQLSPTVNPNDIQNILNVLPQDIRMFCIFRDDLENGSPMEIEAVMQQINSQLQDNYEAETIATVGNSVKELIDSYGITIQELEDYLNSLP